MSKDLTPEQAASLLEKLDEVCRQARELSDAIRKQMVQSARENYTADDAVRRERRKTRKD